MADENQSGFKVTDRRLFNPDGSLREEALELQAAAAAAPAETQPVVDSVQAQSPPDPMKEEGFDDNDLDAMPEQTLFNEFLMGIASSAFIYLGLVEHPATGKKQVDPMAAKESIDMLLMLRDKTKGNLTPGEEKFFDSLLADLKMQFVSLRR